MRYSLLPLLGTEIIIDDDEKVIARLAAPAEQCVKTKNKMNRIHHTTTTAEQQLESISRRILTRDLSCNQPSGYVEIYDEMNAATLLENLRT